MAEADKVHTQHPQNKKIRAYGIVVAHSIRIAGTAVRFRLGPQKIMNIKFYKVKNSSENTEIRLLADFYLPKNIKLPFDARLFRVIQPTDLAVKNKLVLGNHYHPKKSGRWEFFVIFGKTKANLFKFRYKAKNKIKERYLKDGDAILMPQDISHAFLPLVEGVTLFELSNIPYDRSQSIIDKLF